MPDLWLMSTSPVPTVDLITWRCFISFGGLGRRASTLRSREGHLQSTTTCSNHVYLGEESFSLDYTGQSQRRLGRARRLQWPACWHRTNTLRKAAWNGRPEKWYVRALVFDVIELLVGSFFTGFGCRWHCSIPSFFKTILYGRGNNIRSLVP